MVMMRPILGTAASWGAAAFSWLAPAEPYLRAIADVGAIVVSALTAIYYVRALRRRG